jgi:Fe-S oxidoreductase
MSVLVYFFGQKKVAEEGPRHLTSKHHLLIFWGFLLITVGTGELIVAGLVPGFDLGWLLPGFAYDGLRAVIDVFNLIVLVAIGWALFRRAFIRPHLIPLNVDAVIILGGIGSLMVTHFLFHGFEGAAAAAAGTLDRSAPISDAVSQLLANADAAQAHVAAEVAYWTHVVIVLVFLNYLPFSKHIHLLGALPNIALRNLSDRKLDMPTLDLEDENQWGVGRFEQFSWKSLIDNYACTECARCTNYCPAYASGKNLSPMQLVHDIRYEMLDRDNLYAERDRLTESLDGLGGSDRERVQAELAAVNARLDEMPPMVGGRIAEDTLWACTTCGACQEVCPVFIEHPLKIIQMRQNLVLEQEKVPAELGKTFRNLERQGNPWGFPAGERMAWAEGLEVPTVEEKPAPEYILWVGCAGAYDKRIIKHTKAMVKLLKAAGVDYAVLGHSETCTGDPARRAGNELLYQMSAEANVETLNEAGAQKVIASCPHCLHTLRHDYPEHGGNYDVIHHTQLLARLLADGKLEPEGYATGSVVYHDSCYLGRWNGEYDAPREILGRVTPAGGVRDIPQQRQHGMCCGAGGARMWMEEDAPRVNEIRTDQLLDAEAETIAVACPFCNVMITDGMKARGVDEEVSVLDVAELLASQIPDVPASSLVRERPAAKVIE